MIANNSVRSAISIIHLAIGIFCLGLFMMIVSNKPFYFSSFYKNKDFFSLVVLIGCITNCRLCCS